MMVVAQSFASERLHAICARMKAQGERGLSREMNAAFRVGTAPLIAAVRTAARNALPRTGGLNEYEATQVIRVTVARGSRTAGVRIRGKASNQTDRGVVRHPVFGQWLPNQETQQIPQATGWWTSTMARTSPTVTPLLIAELDRVARKINGI